MGIETSGAEIYDAQGLEGPARDFEHVFNSANMKDALAQSREANELYEEVLGVIDPELFPAEGSNLQDIVRAIRIAAKEGNWKSYDDVSFDAIRAELKLVGIPMRKKKTKDDL
jgi:hypothetical protein